MHQNPGASAFPFLVFHNPGRRSEAETPREGMDPPQSPRLLAPGSLRSSLLEPGILGWTSSGGGAGAGSQTRGQARARTEAEVEWSQPIQASLWRMLGQAMTGLLPAEPSGMPGTQRGQSRSFCLPGGLWCGGNILDKDPELWSFLLPCHSFPRDFT